MAILRADEDDSNQTQGMNQQNQTQPQNTQPQVSGSPALGADQSAVAPAAQGASASNASANPKASSGTFTNLRQYINANQGNKVASSVGQKVEKTATGAQRAIGQGQTAFGQKVEQGSLANRENAVSDIKSIVQKARGTSAQPQTAPAPAASNASTSVPAASASASANAPAAAPDYTQGLDTQRFQDVINAQYKGPESLRSSGLYDPISQKVQTAQTKINQAQTASGREDLLKDTFSQNRQYSRGQNKLDSLLLNTSKEGVQGLLDQRAKAGNLQQALQSAENTSSNLATNRASEIKGLQGQARETFTAEQAAERKATDDRLSNVVQDWDKLPEYFKDILRKSPAGAVNLGSQEAGILGIKSGEGLYNLGESAIRTGVADKEKLVSRDEQARQFALSQLAGLDTSRMLDTNVKYSDMAKAGTQTAADALDLQGTRNAINEAEKNFREQAQSQNIVGSGSKKNKTSGKRYYSEAQANLGDVFKNAGYDFDAALSDQIGNADLLRGAGASTNMAQDQDEDNLYTKIGLPTLGEIGNSGQSSAGAAIDSNPVAAGINMGLNLVGGKSIGQTVSNIFGAGANTAQSKSIASSAAQADLQNKLQQAISQSGFQNRANVADTDQTRSRSEALRAMLAKLDKTNVG